MLVDNHYKKINTDAGGNAPCVCCVCETPVKKEESGDQPRKTSQGKQGNESRSYNERYIISLDSLSW